jgi:hypothetical protein
MLTYAVSSDESQSQWPPQVTLPSAPDKPAKGPPLPPPERDTPPGHPSSKSACCKPQRMCVYEHCPSPMHSSKWRVITTNTVAGVAGVAGGRDWQPLLGSTLCDSCYSTYRKHGTFMRAVRTPQGWARPHHAASELQQSCNRAHAAAVVAGVEGVSGGSGNADKQSCNRAATEVVEAAVAGVEAVSEGSGCTHTVGDAAATELQQSCNRAGRGLCKSQWYAPLNVSNADSRKEPELGSSGSGSGDVFAIRETQGEMPLAPSTALEAGRLEGCGGSELGVLPTAGCSSGSGDAFEIRERQGDMPPAPSGALVAGRMRRERAAKTTAELRLALQATGAAGIWQDLCAATSHTQPVSVTATTHNHAPPSICICK